MKKIIIALVVVLAVFAFVGCKNVRISKPSSSQINLTLPSNPTTGCTWSVKVEDENIATYLGSDYTPHSNPNGMVGVGGEEELHFRTQNPGVTKVYLAYGHAWNADEVYSKYTAQITVKEDLSGRIEIIE